MQMNQCSPQTAHAFLNQVRPLLNTPLSLAVHPSGTALYIADSGNNVIRVLTFGASSDGGGAGGVSTLAGSPAGSALVDGVAGDIYELAGDEAFTMAEFAAHVARIAGKPVAYVDMSQADYAAALEGVGLPGWLAAMLANSSYASSQDALFDDSHTLSRLIGRPTTPIADTIAAALA